MASMKSSNTHSCPIGMTGRKAGMKTLYNEFSKYLVEAKCKARSDLLRDAKLFIVDFEVVNGGAVAEMGTNQKLGPVARERLNLPFPKTLIYAKEQMYLFNEVEEGIIEFLTVVRSEGKNTVQFCFSGIMNLDKPTLEADITESFYLNKGKALGEKFALSDEELEPVLKSLMICAYRVIVELNTVDRFIVKSTSVKTSKTKDYPRFRQQPQYIILKPNEIREKLNLKSEEGTTKRVHERRGHVRTYPDDKVKYPKAHGKHVWIKASWVGVSEATVGDRHYKVILD